MDKGMFGGTGAQMISNRKCIDSVISQVVERLVRTYSPERIVLYGSYAYCKPDRNSGIDLLIVKNTQERPIDSGLQ
jgi:predicted nucleotidyltransferase